MKQKTKRILGMFVTLCLVLGLLPGTALAASWYADVSPSDWYYDAVQYVSNKGLMSGTDYTTFDPEGTTTRGTIATILYRMEGSPAYFNTTYTDVPAGEWYAPAVAWARTYSLINGYGDGRFGPDDPITREQLASLLFRYSQMKKYNTSMTGDLTVFTDKGSISSYASIPMSWAVGKGLITGIGDGRLDPQGTATRGQTAEILKKYMENIVDKADPLAPRPGTIPQPAVVEEDPVYTVSFYLNYGGNELYETQAVKAGGKVVKPVTPSRQDSSFLGWYVSRNGSGRAFDFDSEINSDVTLYAVWGYDGQNWGYNYWWNNWTYDAVNDRYNAGVWNGNQWWYYPNYSGAKWYNSTANTWHDAPPVGYNYWWNNGDYNQTIGGWDAGWWNGIHWYYNPNNVNKWYNSSTAKWQSDAPAGYNNYWYNNYWNNGYWYNGYWYDYSDGYWDGYRPDYNDDYYYHYWW